MLPAYLTSVQGLVTFLLLLCPALLPESSEFLAQKREPRKDAAPRDSGGSELLAPPLRKLIVILVANQFLHRLGQQAGSLKELVFQFQQKKGKILGGLLAASSARYGIYAALVGGYMTCSVGTLLYISATDSVSLTIAWGVAYLGEEVANVLAMTIVVQAFPSRLRGRGVSLVSAPNALAGFLAGASGALSAYSIRAPFMVTAASMLTSGAVLLAFSGFIQQPLDPALAPFMVTAASMLTSGAVLLAFSGFIQQQSLEHRSDLKAGKED
ncbi:hypothetical protein AK812_SmicGene18707 [Symbiodinium microadriaticum]|uniref:Uncharacterized protein n=1 Tax=Symbiodinium microadriaticum TaxID=2951 RepID=A0A1Q9DUG0_SYMMI|nr:hypothetical protein AK812_SmicGene18707 [Symbiodinium microadriaticum]